VTDTFLHQDKDLPADQAVDVNAPNCDRCAHSMWLTKVQRTLTDSEIAWRREYECKNCGDVTVQRSTEMLMRAG